MGEKTPASRSQMAGSGSEWGSMDIEDQDTLADGAGRISRTLNLEPRLHCKALGAVGKF